MTYLTEAKGLWIKNALKLWSGSLTENRWTQLTALAETSMPCATNLGRVYTLELQSIVSDGIGTLELGKPSFDIKA